MRTEKRNIAKEQNWRRGGRNGGFLVPKVEEEAVRRREFGVI